MTTTLVAHEGGRMLAVMRSYLLASLAMCLGLSHVARGAPRPLLTGEQKLTVSALAVHPLYPANTFRPTLKVAITGTGPRTVTIVEDQHDKTYPCILKATLKSNRLVFDPNQACNLAISTPDFCLLTAERCAAHLPQRTCAAEGEEGHLGQLTATVTAGSVEQDASGAWKLSADVVVDGCVLVHQHHQNTPVDIQGAKITVRAQ